MVVASNVHREGLADSSAADTLGAPAGSRTAAGDSSAKQHASAGHKHRKWHHELTITATIKAGDLSAPGRHLGQSLQKQLVARLLNHTCFQRQQHKQA